MHTTKRPLERAWRALALAALAGLPWIATGGTAQAQSNDDEGYYGEDEWYDPTDWFDGNNVEWDDTYEPWDEGAESNDGDDYGYDYGYGWYDDAYGYDYRDDGVEYGWHYQWDPRTQSWQRDYGSYEEYYEEPDHYGTHYVWDANQDRWDRRYGWYDDFYSYRNDGSSGGNAKGDMQQRRDSRRTSDSAQRSSSATAGQTSFAGTVDSFNRKRISGQRQSHTLVKVRLEDGSSRVIDLGPRVDLARLDLAQGDSIRVRGKAHRVSGKDVLMANSIRVEGERIPMQWNPGEQGMRQGSDRTNRTSTRQRSSANTMTCEGTIAGFKKIDLPGVSDDHLLVRLRMQDGSTRVVDFGPTARMGQLDLEQDEHATIRGHKRTVNGQSLLVAESVRIGGEKVSVRADEASFRAEKPSDSYHESLQGEHGTSKGSSSSN